MMRAIELLLAVGTGRIILSNYHKKRGLDSSSMESASDPASDAKYSRESQQEIMHISALGDAFDPADEILVAAPVRTKLGLRHILSGEDHLGARREVLPAKSMTSLTRPTATPITPSTMNSSSSKRITTKQQFFESLKALDTVDTAPNRLDNGLETPNESKLHIPRQQDLPYTPPQNARKE
jgi:hypothetical protein